MAKRFIDTGLFDDDWFAGLNQDGKILWIYFLTKCDHAGLLKINKKLIEFQTGIKSFDTVIKQLSNRLLTVDELLFFCPKFILFQYPGFPKSAVRQQSSALDLLIKNGFWNTETNNFTLNLKSQITVSKELTNSYEHVNGHVNGKNIIESAEIFPSFDQWWDLYDKKVDRTSCEKKWLKISQVDREQIMLHTADYKISQPDKQYRKDPETYINRKSWNDEIIKNHDNSRPNQKSSSTVSTFSGKYGEPL